AVHLGSLHCPSAWVGPMSPGLGGLGRLLRRWPGPCAPPDDSKVVSAVVRTTATVQCCRRYLSWNDSNSPTLSSGLDARSLRKCRRGQAGQDRESQPHPEPVVS